MTRSISSACVLLLAGLLGCASSGDSASDLKAVTQEPKAAAGQGQPEMPLPPGWTEADMQACMASATPGEPHQMLAKAAGTWHGKVQSWMAPGTEAMKSECTNTVSMMMDRYQKSEIQGEMPGMGPFHGFGVYGYDNVTKQYVFTWVDNCGTGIMNGTGELARDGKTLTWKGTYNCPLRKGPAPIREVQKFTGPDSMELEMYGNDPKSGVEYKMMHIAFTRKK